MHGLHTGKKHWKFRRIHLSLLNARLVGIFFFFCFIKKLLTQHRPSFAQQWRQQQRVRRRRRWGSSHSIPCSFSSAAAGWFLVFLFSVDWNRLPLNPKNRYTSNNNIYKQQRRRRKKTLRHHAVCLSAHFPIYSFIFKFPKLTFGINSFERR